MCSAWGWTVCVMPEDQGVRSLEDLVEDEAMVGWGVSGQARARPGWSAMRSLEDVQSGAGAEMRAGHPESGVWPKGTAGTRG